MSDDATAQPDRRGYRRALILLAVGAGLLFLGYAQVWASAVVLQEGLPSLAVELKGREIQPAGSASAVLALAGIAGLVATRRFGRAVTGVLLILEGLVALVGALWFGAGAGNRADVVRLVSEKAGIDVEADLSVRPWWLVVAAGGVLLVVVGVLAALRGGTWPVMGRRYERADGDGSAGAAGAPAAEASAWDQLDQGVDPTLDAPTDAPTDTPADTTPEPTRGTPRGPMTGTMSPTDAPEDTP